MKMTRMRFFCHEFRDGRHHLFLLGAAGSAEIIGVDTNLDGALAEGGKRRVGRGDGDRQSQNGEQEEEQQGPGNRDATPPSGPFDNGDKSGGGKPLHCTVHLSHETGEPPVDDEAIQDSRITRIPRGTVGCLPRHRCGSSVPEAALFVDHDSLPRREVRRDRFILRVHQVPVEGRVVEAQLPLDLLGQKGGVARVGIGVG